MNKRAIEFSFAWLFAMIAGAAILFISIYAVVGVINSGERRAEAELTSEIAILLDPMGAGIEDESSLNVSFPTETRIFNSCRTEGNFGEQRISANSAGISGGFREPEIEKISYDKYLFSDSVEQGERLHLFVKSFEMPFEVGSLIYAYTEEYCFVNPPQSVEESRAERVVVASQMSECNRESIKVCFSGNVFDSGCDINVDTSSERVTHNLKGKTVSYYGDALLYGAIFAEPEIYECQVQRLMKRAGELAQLYAAKSEIFGGSCGAEFAEELRIYAAEIQLENSGEIEQIALKSEDLRRTNERLSCKFF